jgi:MtfA peptidase
VLFRWLNRRRRRRIAAEPMPPGWDAILDAIPHVPILAGARRPELADAVKIFVAEKQFFGAKDLEVTDEMRVTVAALASLMTLGMPEFFFDHVSSIILHRSIIRAPKKVSIGTEAMLEDEIEELGDATLHGPVRLMWPQIEEDMREPWCGRNLVFHEFAHQLDMMNGSADGVPILPRDLRKPWQSIMLTEYDKLMRATWRRRRTLIDPYGATGPEEFFAVASETFFDAPLDLRIEHPDLYAIFVRYYGQDPAVRFDEWERSS